MHTAATTSHAALTFSPLLSATIPKERRTERDHCGPEEL